MHSCPGWSSGVSLYFFCGATGNAEKDFSLRKTLSCHCFGVFRRSSAFALGIDHTPRTACPKTAKQWHVRIAYAFHSRRKLLRGVGLRGHIDLPSSLRPSAPSAVNPSDQKRLTAGRRVADKSGIRLQPDFPYILPWPTLLSTRLIRT